MTEIERYLRESAVGDLAEMALHRLAAAWRYLPEEQRQRVLEAIHTFLRKVTDETRTNAM
jgi:hypothetical protein